MDKDFVALSRRSIKPEEKNNQLCNNSDGKLEEISFKSPSLVSLPLICRIVRGFISVHADLYLQKMCHYVLRQYRKQTFSA